MTIGDHYMKWNGKCLLCFANIYCNTDKKCCYRKSLNIKTQDVWPNLVSRTLWLGQWIFRFWPWKRVYNNLDSASYYHFNPNFKASCVFKSVLHFLAAPQTVFAVFAVIWPKKGEERVKRIWISQQQITEHKNICFLFLRLK